jgi:cell shape-determining protein MreC
MNPLWSVGKGVTSVTKKILPSLFSGAALVEENQRLKDEIAILRIESWRAAAIENERDILRGMLGRSSTTDDSLLAYVLATPNFAPYDTLVLDVGKDTGIWKGARVMTDGGFIIGTVTEVLATRSIAQLYSSPGLVRDVVVGSARIPAVAHGVGGGNYRVELPKNTDIKEGDEVSVAGAVEEFLGVVERVVVDDKTGITTLFLRLPINMTELRSVIIDLSPTYE